MGLVEGVGGGPPRCSWTRGADPSHRSGCTGIPETLRTGGGSNPHGLPVFLGPPTISLAWWWVEAGRPLTSRVGSTPTSKIVVVCPQTAGFWRGPPGGSCADPCRWGGPPLPPPPTHLRESSNGAWSKPPKPCPPAKGFGPIPGLGKGTCEPIKGRKFSFGRFVPKILEFCRQFF